MSYMVRSLVRLALPAAVVLSPSLAFGWVETQIKSYGATVDVGHDGRAVVSHELVLGIRGGPLKSFEGPGVDADAEPLPDATVTPTVNGAASLPLLLERRDDGVLVLEVDHEKGLRSGRYAFVFRYRTDLAKRGMLLARGSRAELRWVSPHFDQGIDSMRVLLRLPPTNVAPALPNFDARDPDVPFGAFIETLRRAPDKDELEIIRPYVAKGEPVVWRADVSPTLAPQADDSSDAAGAPAPGSPAPRRLEPARERLQWWGVAAAVALVYGLLVWLKAWAFARSCRPHAAQARPLLPLPTGVRAPLSGLSLSAALVLAVPLAEPTFGAALLVLALALAALRAPLLSPAPRGPGQWLPLKEEEVFRRLAPRELAHYLDASRLPGFLLFALGVGGSVAAAVVLLRRSPYEALLALMASAILLPIFLSGRGLDLPLHPLAHARSLAALCARLKRRRGTKVVPWARVSDLSGQPDELRLLVQPKPSPPGLVALELGVESLPGLGGAVASPYVLVRVKDGADVQRRLPRSAVWTRGRRADERVAIFKPALPSVRSCLALALELLRAAESAASGAGDQPSRRASSSGKFERTAKLGRVPSPAHAT